MKKSFNDIKVRNCVKARIFEKGKWDWHPILVIGRNKEKLYGIRVSPKDKSNEDFYLCENSFDYACKYYSLDKIYEIEEKDYQGLISVVPAATYNEIINSIIINKNYLEYIDFSYVRIPINNDSILYINGELYITGNRTSSECYEMFKLEENIKSKHGLKINGTRYIINTKVREKINIYDDEYFVIYHDNDLLNKLIKKSDKKEEKSLKFGDVITLKGNNKMVIYISEYNDFIYYATFDQMDFFTGLNKIEESKVLGFSRRLDENELKTLSTKIERPLSSGKYLVYSEIKDNILNEVKKYKK